MHDDTLGRRSFRSVSWWLSGTGLAFALSCGAASVSEEHPAPAASAGDEPPPSAAAAPTVPERDVVPVKSGRGHLVVQAEVAGKSVPAHAKLLEGDSATDFEMGEQVSAESGTRRIEVSLADDSVLVDKPTQELEVFVEPHKTAQVKAVFPWAKVQLNLLVSGRPQPATHVKLVRAGKVVADVHTGAPMFEVSPGNYEADVPLRGKTVRVKGLVFFEGSEQVIPVRAQ